VEQVQYALGDETCSTAAQSSDSMDATAFIAVRQSKWHATRCRREPVGQLRSAVFDACAEDGAFPS